MAGVSRPSGPILEGRIGSDGNARAAWLHCFLHGQIGYGPPLIFCLVACSALSTSRAITLFGILPCPRRPEFTCQMALTASKSTRFVDSAESGTRTCAPLLLGSVPAVTRAPASALWGVSMLSP